MKSICESKAGQQASVTGWYAKEGLFARWTTCIQRVVEKTPQAAEEMSSVPHVASTDQQALQSSAVRRNSDTPWRDFEIPAQIIEKEQTSRCSQGFLHSPGASCQPSWYGEVIQSLFPWWHH